MELPSNSEEQPLQRTISASQTSDASQTAAEFISSQLQLEADAREVLPYQFDTCTHSLGPLRQSVFSCLTCNPPPSNPSDAYSPAGVCYACSISCHGDHQLVELFTRRNFVCDCGTKRLPVSSPCSLRINGETGTQGGVHSEQPSATNRYNHNFRNRFCGCGQLYDPHTEEGTMYQCYGIGDTEDGSCGEDWWHPECLLGIDRNWYKAQIQKPEDQLEHPADEHPDPPGFPKEDDFEHLMCYKCVGAFPWIKPYAGAPGFLPGVPHQATLIEQSGALIGAKSGASDPTVTASSDTASAEAARKRKADEILTEQVEDSSVKRAKSEETKEATESQQSDAEPIHAKLSQPPSDPISLFLKPDFREHLCHCADCFPRLARHPHLLEEEVIYEPPMSSASSAANGREGSGSVGSKSLLDRGEAALSNMDRVKAIEGVMVYNHLRDKVKDFLKPFAESGQPVGADDVKKYFEKLRGDDEDIRLAQMSRGATDEGGGGGGTGDGDNRREQGGY